MSTDSIVPALARHGSCPLCGKLCGIRCADCGVYRLCVRCPGHRTPGESPFCAACLESGLACISCEAPVAPAAPAELQCNKCGEFVICSVCGGMRDDPEARHHLCGVCHDEFMRDRYAEEYHQCDGPADCSRCGSSRDQGDGWLSLCGLCVDAVHGAEAPSCPGCGRPTPDGECLDCPHCRDCGVLLIRGDGAYGRCGDCASEFLRTRHQD